MHDMTVSRQWCCFFGLPEPITVHYNNAILRYKTDASLHIEVVSRSA